MTNNLSLNLNKNLVEKIKANDFFKRLEITKLGI